MGRVSVKVQCCNGHAAELNIDDLSILHLGGVVTGYTYACPRCGERNETVATASVVAILHAFGATTLATAVAGTRPPEPIDAHTQIVSLRVLLDQPDALARLTGQQSGSRAVSEGDAAPAP